MSDVVYVEKKKRGCGFWVLVALGVIIFLGVIGAIFGDPVDSDGNGADQVSADSSSDPVSIPEDRKVTSSYLAGVYANNEVSAQQWADAGPIQVTGPIEAIELDFMDDPVIRLQGAEMFQLVSIYFGKDASNVVGSLSKGQTITVVCSDVSEVIGSPQLKECVISE